MRTEKHASIAQFSRPNKHLGLARVAADGSRCAKPTIVLAALLSVSISAVEKLPIQSPHVPNAPVPVLQKPVGVAWRDGNLYVPAISRAARARRHRQTAQQVSDDLAGAVYRICYIRK